MFVLRTRVYEDLRGLKKSRYLGIGLVLFLGACAQASVAPQAPAPAPNVTNAPAFASIAKGSEEDMMLNVGRRTYFKGSSAKLDETAKIGLDKRAAWLSTHTHWNIKLQGFADDPGSAKRNLELSQRRATAVRDYLASKGVAKSRMWAKGYGRDRLVRDCPEIECKSQNRRVVTNPGEYPEIAARQR